MSRDAKSVDSGAAMCVIYGMEQIFALWPNMSDLAADLGKPYTTVQSWAQRRSIPARFDLDLIEAARKRGVALTLEDLAVARRNASVDHEIGMSGFNTTPARLKC